MIHKRRILTSATSSVIQIAISGISLFILYRFLLETIGVVQMGIWSLVLAMSSMIQVSNLGLTGSIVKNIADYDALGDKRSIARAIQTAAISIALLSLAFMVCAYPGAKYYFGFAMEGQAYNDALEVLPPALIAFWIMMVTSIYQSGLYGCQLIAQRNSLLIFESISHLSLCLYLTPHYGLLGLAYARIIQNAVTLVASVLILRRHLPQLPLFPLCWDKKLFKEMIGYATSFQVISLLTMLADPVTKAILARFGSISMVGYFEMASKLVQQFRSLIGSVNQVLVPTFAHLKQLEPHRITALYLSSYHLTFYLSLAGFGLLVICAPLVSSVWVGEYEPFFVGSTIVLCAGWLINTLSIPAYYACMGTGDMRINVVAHIVMTILNIILSVVFGWFLGGFGVVLAWGIALAIGGVLLIILFCRAYHIPFGTMLPIPDRILTSCCIAGIVFAYLLLVNLPEASESLMMKFNLSFIRQSFITGGAMILVYLGFMIVPLWSHPLRKNLQRWGQETLSGGKP
jgi:O-antigen/teichoic acid export membrane protein